MKMKDKLYPGPGTLLAQADTSWNYVLRSFHKEWEYDSGMEWALKIFHIVHSLQKLITAYMHDGVI